MPCGPGTTLLITARFPVALSPATVLTSATTTAVVHQPVSWAILQYPTILYTPWHEAQDYEVCVYLEMHTHTHTHIYIYIWASISEYFQSVFHFEHHSHGQSKKKDTGNEESHVILMAIFTEVIPLRWATRYAETISQNLRVLCFDWLHLCISTHCQ
jgi:hypothetical protein